MGLCATVARTRVSDVLVQLMEAQIEVMSC